MLRKRNCRNCNFFSKWNRNRNPNKIKLKRWDNKLLGNNAASMNIRKAKVFTKSFCFKTAFYGLDSRYRARTGTVNCQKSERQNWNQNRKKYSYGSATRFKESSSVSKLVTISLKLCTAEKWCKMFKHNACCHELELLLIVSLCMR